MLTALPETVTAPTLTNSPAAPALVIMLDLILMAEDAIDEGTPVLVLKVTVKVPPTGTATVDVTAMVYWPSDRALVGVTVTIADDTSALAGLAENIPKAIIVTMTPTAMSSTSPKDVPILVFIYSYLLDLHALSEDNPDDPFLSDFACFPV
jgi:hypothetical protein